MSRSKTKLLELINSSNFPPLPLSEANVELSSLAPASGSADWNTSVVVTAKAGQGYSGSRTVFYRRLALSVITASTPSFPVAQTATPQALLDALNAAYGSWLELEDLEPFTIPAVATGSTAAVVLTALPSSFGWTGELTVQLQGNQSLPGASVSNGLLL